MVSRGGSVSRTKETKSDKDAQRKGKKDTRRKEVSKRADGRECTRSKQRVETNLRVKNIAGKSKYRT